MQCSLSEARGMGCAPTGMEDHMGRIIRSTADTARIEEHVRRALRTALARGGDLGQAAQDRLGAAVATMDEALAAHRAAGEAEANAWAGVLAEDAKSDVVLGNVR